MNEREFHQRIKQDLNYETGQLPNRIHVRLKQSRERALEAFSAQLSLKPEHVFAGYSAGNQKRSLSHGKWLPFILVPMLLIGVMLWQQQTEPANHEDNIDAALLASDIPLSAIVDQNFHSWLKHSSQQP